MSDHHDDAGLPPADPGARLPELRTELREIAERLLHGEVAGHTLQPTALVHEAWFRMAGPRALRPVDRTHFLALAAPTMRTVLVEHARQRHAREGAPSSVDLTIADDRLGFAIPIDDLLEVDAALSRLGEEHPRLARVVELRFFAGLSEDETARELGITTRAVQRDWARARRRLQLPTADRSGRPDAD